MAINHDAATFQAADFTTTGASAAISHAGNASARAACVLIAQLGATDEVTDVTYAGVSMARVRSESEATEAGRVYIYWLDGIAGGTQDVVVTTSAGSAKRVIVATMTVAAGQAVQVAGSGTGTSASASNPSWTITGLTAGQRLVAYEVIHSGLQTMTNTPAASWTLLGSPGFVDRGATGFGTATQTVASSGTSLTCGWTAATAEDFVADSVAFREVAAPPVQGDASLAVTVGLSAGGTRGAVGAASLAVTVGLAADSTVTPASGAIAIRGSTPATATDNGGSATVALTVTGTRQPQANNTLLIIHSNDFYDISNMPTPTVDGSTTGVNPVTGGTADAGASSAHAKAYTWLNSTAGDRTISVTETGSHDEEKALVVYVLSGVDTSSPVDVAGNTASGTSTSPWVLGSISPTSADAFLIGHVVSGGGSNAGGSVTPPGTMAEAYDVTLGGITYEGATEQLAASGATGTRTFTPAASASWAGLLIALKPAGGSTAHQGDASLAVTVGLAATGVRGAVATASLAVAVGLASTGVRGAVATASLAVTAGLTAAGAVGTPPVLGDASLAVTVGLAATGRLDAVGAASLPVAVGLSASGVRGAVATASLAVTAGLSAAGVRGALADASLAVTVGLASGGVRTQTATASLAVTVTVAASASPIGNASLPVTAGLTATASRTATAGASLPVQITFASGALVAHPGAASLPVTVSFTVGGTIAHQVGASLAIIVAFIATATATGAVITRPFTGTTGRPNSGITTHPFTGVVTKP